MPSESSADRRRTPRTPTLIQAVAKTGQGQRQNLEVSDLSAGGCAVVTRSVPLRPGVPYGLKIGGLETLGTVTTWIAGNAAGLEFDRPLHPAVADHLANLHPRPIAAESADQVSSVVSDENAGGG